MMAGLSCEGLVDTHADWVNRAACRGADVDLFFAQRGEPIWPALEYCKRCEVRAECLNYALKNGITQGVWGGLSPRKRRGMAPSDRYFSRAARARIVWLDEQGWSRRDIAAEFDCTERSVYRVLARERERV